MKLKKLSIFNGWVVLSALVSLLNGNALAETTKTKFYVDLPGVASTQVEASLKDYCQKQGYTHFESYRREPDTHTYFVICVGELADVEARLASLSCQDVETPISQFENEIQGKLFFVQTLPGLSEDGKLIATYKPNGVHVGERYFAPEIRGDSLDTLHFAVNSLVQFNGGFGGERYTDHPYVVIFPVNQPKKHNILDAVTSISFTEAVVLGDYTLPPNAIIMYRGSHESSDDELIAAGGEAPELNPWLRARLSKLDEDEQQNVKKTLSYYEKQGFRVIPFHDSEPGFSKRRGLDNETNQEVDLWFLKNIRNGQKKYDAVKKVILEEGGFDIRPESKSYFSTKIPGPNGTDLNTPELAKKLFPGKDVSFGLDDFTRLDSPGEQWRSMSIRGNWPRIHDAGYSIEEHHSQKFNQWIKSLNPPAEALEHHFKVNRENRIAFRANDLIFGHFKNKEKAVQYIQKHVEPRVKDPEFKVRFEEGFKSGKSVDELAKDYVDFDHLKTIKDTGPFNLASGDDLQFSLFTHTLGMHPQEALPFLNEYFEKSSVFNDPYFSEEKRKEIKVLAKNYYAFAYFIREDRPKILSKSDREVLLKMMDLKQGLLPIQNSLGTILGVSNLDAEKFSKLSSEEQGAFLNREFGKIYEELSQSTGSNEQKSH